MKTKTIRSVVVAGFVAASIFISATAILPTRPVRINTNPKTNPMLFASPAAKPQLPIPVPTTPIPVQTGVKFAEQKTEGQCFPFCGGKVHTE